MEQINKTHSVNKLRSRSAACFLVKYGLKKAVRPINCDLYAYAANNPLRYIDPDGNFIRNIYSVNLMQTLPWGDEYINTSKTFIRNEGCVITGLSNIFTDMQYRANGAPREWLTVTPSNLNKEVNFSTINNDEIDFDAVASNYNLTITRSKHGDSESARNLLKTAAVSPMKMYVMARVKVTITAGDIYHWINVDGNPVDLFGDGRTWIKVSPTSDKDYYENRKRNSNWVQGDDGNLYVNTDNLNAVVTIY